MALLPQKKYKNHRCTTECSGDLRFFDSWFIFHIEGMCTVTKADDAAVLQALESVIGTALAQGDSVRLGTLGSFRVKMSAKAAESPEAVTADNITDV